MSTREKNERENLKRIRAMEKRIRKSPGDGRHDPWETSPADGSAVGEHDEGVKRQSAERYSRG